MIAIYNASDSYFYYKQNIFKDRTDKLNEIYKNEDGYQPFKDSYDRYTGALVAKINRMEKTNGIDNTEIVTIAIYLKIIYGYFKFLIKKLFEGHDIRLPVRLGIIAIRGRKVIPTFDWKGDIKGVAPSWSKTKISWTEKAKELGLSLAEYIEKIPKKERNLVYCFNEHSEFIKYRIVWFRNKAIVNNKTFYGLTFNRVNRRMLWKLINEGKEYYVIEPNK